MAVTRQRITTDVRINGTVTARLRHITNVQRDAFGLGWKVTLSFLVG